MEIMEMTIARYHEALVNGEITTRELIQFYLDRIEKYDQAGPSLNAVICVNQQVLDEADRLDGYFRQHGLSGPLHGVPVLLKDNVQTVEMPTTAGSQSLQGFMAEEDATLVRRLKAAGALIIAKTNLHEFAIWGETVSSILGQTLNPYDLSRTPGGSSGGTGAAVAANFGLVGIGTDTINSVRSPASANALVGIRPTIGLVSRDGIVPYSMTQDTAGPITRSVVDAARVLEVIQGFDPLDPVTAWSVNRESVLVVPGDEEQTLKGSRIGVLETFFGSGESHSEVTASVRSAIEVMRSLGAEIVPMDVEIDSDDLTQNVSVHLHDLKDHLNHYLSGLPFNAPVHSMEEILTSGRFHSGIRENLEIANRLGTGTQAYHRRLIRRSELQDRVMFLMAEAGLEAIVYPHQKQLVCEVGGSQAERNGVLASVTGFPSVCVPAGYSAPTETAPLGIPIGMEIMGRPFSEKILIEIAQIYERRARVRRPPQSTDE